MSKKYSVAGSAAAGTTKTNTLIIGTAAIRPMIYELIASTVTTPADIATQFSLQRSTANGTAGSNPTPNPLDPADAASVTTAGIAHSGEPTYTANSTMMVVDLNQRATWRWVANPGCEIVCVVGANKGLGFQSVSSGGTPTYDLMSYFTE